MQLAHTPVGSSLRGAPLGGTRSRNCVTVGHDQCFTLALGQTTPHPVRLLRGQPMLSTRGDDRTGGTQREGRPVAGPPSGPPLALGVEEQIGVLPDAGAVVLPFVATEYGGRKTRNFGHGQLAPADTEHTERRGTQGPDEYQDRLTLHSDTNPAADPEIQDGPELAPGQLPVARRPAAVLLNGRHIVTDPSTVGGAVGPRTFTVFGGPDGGGKGPGLPRDVRGSPTLRSGRGHAWVRSGMLSGSVTTARATSTSWKL